ncbi:MAG: hypothetical protein WBM50_06965, partial [Acidimicrobiales bacterium]
MALIERTSTVDAAGLQGLRTARTDLLVERPVGPDQWTVETGPFRSYRRTLQVAPDQAPGHTEHTEHPEHTEHTEH